MDKSVNWARILANGKHEDVRAGGREEIGSRFGYTPFLEDNLVKISKQLCKRVITTLEGKLAKGGAFPVVLGPPVAGVFAHEACGHLFEADLTQNGAIGNNLGETIATEEATIIDDGIIPDGIGSYKYDDEGVPAQRTIILERGRVNAILTNREYAYKFSKILEKKDIEVEHSPSGNARAFDYRVPPIIRMRNTYFNPGDYSFEELLEPIKFGYWVVDFRGGQAGFTEDRGARHLLCRKRQATPGKHKQ